MPNIEEIWKNNLENLLQKAEAGDQNAHKALWTHYEQPMTAYARQFTADEEKAHAAVTRAFDKALTEAKAAYFEERMRELIRQELQQETPVPVVPVRKKSKVLPVILGLAVAAAAIFGGIQIYRGMSKDNGKPAAQNKPTEAPVSSPEGTQAAPPAESSAPAPEVNKQHVIWAEEPDLAAEEIELVRAPGQSNYEEIGYPIEWENYAEDQDLDHGLIAYRNGRILTVSSFDRQKTVLTQNVGSDSGLPAYDLLLDKYAITIRMSDPNIFWIFANNLSYADRVAIGGMGGYFPPNEYDAAQNRIMRPGGADPVTGPEGVHVYLAEYTYSGKTDTLYIADSQGYVYDKREENYPRDFINGFYSYRNKPLNYTEFDTPDTDVRYGLKRIEDGTAVTEAVYEQVMYYTDGYCAVKKDGKWGFINEQGKEVTDFIWDMVTPVYQGKAYVGINGIFGILDLKQTLDKGIPVTEETVYGDNIPQAGPKEDRSGPIGELKVKVSNLNSRSEPTSYADKLAKVKDGMVYSVYEYVYNTMDGYTWYRIGDGRWIADDSGKWVDYTPY